MNDMKLRYYFVKALVSKAQAWERNGTGNYISGFKPSAVFLREYRTAEQGILNIKVKYFIILYYLFYIQYSVFPPGYFCKIPKQEFGNTQGKYLKAIFKQLKCYVLFISLSLPVPVPVPVPGYHFQFLNPPGLDFLRELRGLPRLIYLIYQYQKV